MLGMRAVKWLFSATALACLLLVPFAYADAVSINVKPTASTNSVSQSAIAQDGAYTSREQVALYLRTYRRLPKNFITKAEARRLGWTGGPLEPYAPGKSIGGDHFGNYERKLPNGRYRECDIDTRGRPRGAKRLIYTEDVKRIYYTGDHYRTFQGVP